MFVVGAPRVDPHLKLGPAGRRATPGSTRFRDLLILSAQFGAIAWGATPWPRARPSSRVAVWGGDSAISFCFFERAGRPPLPRGAAPVTASSAWPRLGRPQKTQIPPSGDPIPLRAHPRFASGPSSPGRSVACVGPRASCARPSAASRLGERRGERLPAGDYRSSRLQADASSSSIKAFVGSIAKNFKPSMNASATIAAIPRAWTISMNDIE
jgi:hypothetical protein